MYYILQVSLYEDFHELLVNKTIETVTQATIQDGLEYFTVYWWRVKSVNPINGQESAWSIPCWFKIVAEDITIYHEIGEYSYIMYGSEIYGLEHKFVTDQDYNCEIPKAEIGLGFCGPTSGVANIGMTTCCPSSAFDPCDHYCPGTWVPEYNNTPTMVYILTEDCLAITTEDGIALLSEF